MRIGPNPYPPGSDEHYVHEALRLAEASMGWTSPNPAVGSILVRDGRIVGRGAHQRLGDLHAEAMALQDAGDARGATCYVSLEPCSHIGRQPSCCHLLAQAGVRRVVWGCADGDPRSANRATAVLGDMGLELRSGVLEAECAAFLDHYLLAQREQRCFLHLKLALSLDARLACANGASQWLSGPESLGLAHYLRWKYDGVLVGWRTVLADNPRLTLRPEVLEPYYPGALDRSFRQPVRIVLDPRFELLPRLLEAPQDFDITQLQGQRDDLPGLIIVGAADYLPALPTPPGWMLLAVAKSPAGGLDLPELRVKLYDAGLRSLLVEGGARLAQSMIAQQAVDKLSLVYTPILIGADGLGFSPELNCESVEQCPRLLGNSLEILGQDCVMHGYPSWSPLASMS